MIIFGVKTRSKDYGQAYRLECPRCTNDVLFHAYKERRWGHLFWIPLLPFTAMRGFVCPICSHTIETDRGGLKLGKAAVETIERYDAGEASQDEVNAEFETIDEYLGIEIADVEGADSAATPD